MANDWRETVEEVLALQDDPEIRTSPGPALQWYPAQWLGDSAVQLMSMEARGAHHHLLMLGWKGFAVEGDAVPCSIPADPDVLRALCLHPAGWEEIWPQISRAWKELGGRFWNLGLCREYLRQMSKRRSAKANADARWERTQSGNDANAREPDANASNGDANASKRECSSSSTPNSPLQTSEKSPPSPQGVTKPSRPKGRKIPAVRIPEELRLIGIDQGAFAERVRTCSTTKKPETWQKELDRLAPLVAECGGAVVFETWEDAIASGWQGCTPEFVRRKANGKGPPDKPRGRFSQPHTIAPGSSGKDHGIDY